METAVLIPCYNEEQTIKKVVEEFKAALPHATIYVYDNNSTDDTYKIASELDCIVRKEYKQGKGNVVRSMFRDIEADCYIMADGDDTYPPECAGNLEKYVLSGEADLVVGDRLSSTYFQENKRPFHNVGNRLVRDLINMIYRGKLKDIMTGYRAFSRDFVKMYPAISKGFEIETEMTIFALDNNFKIVETPVDYRDRPDGSESKLNTYSDGIKVLKTIAALFRDTKPFLFFSLISIVLLIISGIFFFPIFFNFLDFGIVDKMPTLIVTSSIGIIAILNFFCGVVLTVLKKQHRQNFEHFLTLLHETNKKKV